MILSANIAACQRDARAAKRLRTSHAITVCAQELALAHGLDGFTMDDLAERSGVSRRTLFNYFSGKDDALLGGPPVVDADLFAEFTAGGPHGDLVADLAEIVLSVLRERPETREDVARGREVMLVHPRLIALAHTRLQETVESCMPYVEQREGAGFSRTRFDVAITLVLACFHLAMDRYLGGDPDAELADLFTESLGTARDLLT